MPETTVNKDYLSMAGQNQVRTTGQRANVESEAVAVSVYEPSYNQFGLCVSVPNKSHLLASLCGRERVCHT